MKKLETFKNELFGKDLEIDSSLIASSVVGGGTTKSSKCRTVVRGDDTWTDSDTGGVY